MREQAPGDEVAEYDIVMEVDTEELTENAYKVGKFAGNVTLLVEAQVQIKQSAAMSTNWVLPCCCPCQQSIITWRSTSSYPFMCFCPELP